MNERVWLAALVYPAPLYAALYVLSQLWDGTFPIVAGFALAFVFGTVTAVGILRNPIVVNGGRIALSLFLLPVFAYWTVGGALLDFSVGVMIGSAFLWLEFVWRADATAGSRIVALQMTFLTGILSLAAVSAAPGVAGGSPGARFLSGIYTVLSGQVQGIAAVLTGGFPPAMPLETTLNVAFVAFAAVAVVGLLVPWLVPHTALGEALPWTWARTAPPTTDEEAVAQALGLRPAQREALATRTRPNEPRTVVPPGFVSLLITAVVVVGFVILAVAAPTIALGILVLGLVAATVTTALVLSRRLTSVGDLAG